MIRSLVTAALLCHLLFLLFLTTSTVWAFPNVWMEAPTRVYSTGLVTSIYDTIDYDVQIRDALVEGTFSTGNTHYPLLYYYTSIIFVSLFLSFVSRFTTSNGFANGFVL